MESEDGRQCWRAGALQGQLKIKIGFEDDCFNFELGKTETKQGTHQVTEIFKQKEKGAW